MQLNTVNSSEEPWKPVMVQSCYWEHRAPTTHPYSVVFWSRRIQCEWPLPEVVQWADLIFANLQWFPYNHCTSSTSWAVCLCHQLSDSDLGGLLAWLIFLCLSADHKSEYSVSHTDWPFIGMFAVGTTVEDNKIKHECEKIHILFSLGT